MIKLEFTARSIQINGVLQRFNSETIDLARKVVKNHQDFDYVHLEEDGEIIEHKENWKLRNAHEAKVKIEVGKGEDGVEITPDYPVPEIGSKASITNLVTLFRNNLSGKLKQEAKERIRTAIDGFADRLLAKYTDTAQKGWSTWLQYAKAYKSTGNPDDAGSLVLNASIRNIPLEERVEQILQAAQITALLPDLADGFQARANALIEASSGTFEDIQEIEEMLINKQTAIALAIQSGDQQAVLAEATQGWDIQ